MNGPQITFFGNLVQDPESRFSQNRGIPFTTMRVAVNTYRGREREPETNYFNVTLWGTQAQTALNRARKGHHVHVQGLYSRNEYTRMDGSPGTSYHVNAKEFTHIGPPRSADPESEENRSRQNQQDNREEKPEANASAQQGAEGQPANSPESGSPESGSPESGSPESGSPESGSPESGSRQPGIRQPGIRQPGAKQPGIRRPGITGQPEQRPGHRRSLHGNRRERRGLHPALHLINHP